jgi:hypothetical protein
MSLECLHSSVGEEFKRFLRENSQKCRFTDWLPLMVLLVRSRPRLTACVGATAKTKSTATQQRSKIPAKINVTRIRSESVLTILRGVSGFEAVLVDLQGPDLRLQCGAWHTELRGRAKGSVYPPSAFA